MFQLWVGYIHTLLLLSTIKQPQMPRSWMQSKYDQYHFYYLDRINVTRIQEGGTPTTFISEGAQSISPPQLIFLMVEHCHNFKLPFFMSLNIHCHEVLLMTIGGNQEQMIAEQYWFKTLWRSVLKLFGISNQSTSDPDILYGNWITVCLSFLNKRQRCHSCLIETWGPQSM